MAAIEVKVPDIGDFKDVPVIELLVKPGDVVIQRGTNHAWSNRSGKNVKMLYVLIDGDFTPELEKTLWTGDRK